ncbi:MAG: hypothetical protein UV74_C0013G0534 [Candidatus Woesebacteria bacterium GW2011_GWB1_43_14]|uniref:Uncharacterized protein n=1 Tax=Candidatus Woesebacteria bacterium GW2011_GWB1_43_14 TaxID=1618578 RepID=A0A0G1DIJ2_9BACT|nr:MAG: hypothetical protein UT21_C0001G0247 [Candidatus Woesebacteria bacterium GW2011_GWA1_39_11b]KKS78007.1 MAG: hypothetical protein UV51_C0003G0042 [Candidatus Woesebacteria bacterium GW2011_GWC1_42_9]KKS97412.1 MAG: hypothetical protein UV74_C0013G0534 [Candidatus Woesebacteria bacterium GW2011_GWB1_43_14]
MTTVVLVAYFGSHDHQFEGKLDLAKRVASVNSVLELEKAMNEREDTEYLGFFGEDGDCKMFGYLTAVNLLDPTGDERSRL